MSTCVDLQNGDLANPLAKKALTGYSCFQMTGFLKKITYITIKIPQSLKAAMKINRKKSRLAQCHPSQDPSRTSPGEYLGGISLHLAAFFGHQDIYCCSANAVFILLLFIILF